MAKTSKGVILSQASQIKSDYSFALIKATADNKSLVQDASSAELKVNALVEYSKDSQWDPKKLTSLGFPAGCFLIVDLRGQDIHAADLITNLALVRQYGYQAGVIDDLSTLDDIKALKANQIYLINSGKTNDDQDASLNGNEITDGSGKLAVGMSVKWQRDYTNVDVSGDRAGFVGMGQDTLLKGGNAFGYSTNGRDFNAVITPKGLIFRRPDAERMWRLLKPNEIADINSTVGDKVKKEVDSATAEIPAAVSAANSAVSAAESAVAASKVNSDAIKAMASAASEAKSGADQALKDAQTAIKNVGSEAAAIRKDVADVAGQVKSVQSANTAQAKAMQDDLDKAKSSISATSSSLDKISTNLDTYAKSAAEQGHDITELKKQQGKLEADLASANGNVVQLQATVSGIQGNLKDTNKNVASLSASASQAGVAMKNAQSQVAQAIMRADKLQATIADQDKKILTIQATASGASVVASAASSAATEAKLTASDAEVVASDAKHNILTATATASDAKMLATNASSQAMQASAAADHISVTLSGIEKTASSAANQASKAQSAADNAIDTVTTVQTQLKATQKELSGKADQATVDDTNKKVSDLSGQVDVIAGQVKLSAKQTSVDELKKQSDKQEGEIQANATGLFSKADKTTTDALNHTVQQQQAQQQVLADQIKTKVTSSDVQGILANGHYATQEYTQSIVDQTSRTLNSNITEAKRTADSNHQADVIRMTNLQQSIDGIQGVVKNKADQSTVTQLANTYQVKLTGNLLASLGKKAQKYTVGYNTFFPFASIDVTKVTNGTVLTLSFDYSSDADCAFAPQLDGTPWVPWGDIKDNPISVKANVPGHYVKQITVGDDSWTKGTAKNIAFRIDNFGGTFTVSNLTLRSGDNVASTFDMLQHDMDLRVQKGDLLSQINLTAGNTLIQSNKLYLDASSVVFSGRAFIPSAAIASLSADKINTGWLNTNNVSLGDGRTRIRADHDYMYIQPTGSAASNTGIRMGYSGLDFLTNVIPNGYSSSVPYYSVGYDGAANGYFKISAFDHINPGGATATQNWFSMVDAISLTNSEINFATKGNMHMQVVDGGVNIKPTLFFQNNTNNGTWAGFTRGDNSNIVEFSTGDNNGENFRIDCGAHFMQYVSINGYARAQGWLTNSTLSKKTNIRKLDQQVALDKIRQDDQYLYEYKRNVEQGIYDPQASFIIDDVNDVSRYSAPREFIDQSGNYREPNVELAYLIAAFQAIDKQVQKQKEEIKELKEKLQHE